MRSDYCPAPVAARVAPTRSLLPHALRTLVNRSIARRVCHFTGKARTWSCNQRSLFTVHDPVRVGTSRHDSLLTCLALKLT